MYDKPLAEGTEIPNMAELFSTYAAQEVTSIALELEKRGQESLSLYEPLPFQERFHACRTKECIIQKGNQVGGTLCLAVEMARALTGQDPHNKYPKENGKAVVLVYGEKHIGRVIYPALFRAGLFKIIKDEKTKKWRAFKPWQDSHREAQAKPAPPLIPQRYIEDISWEKKGERVFSLVTMKNGWELYALNSAGDPSQAQGFQTHLYAIDEDLAQPGWYDEAVGRTAILQGFIRWSALPHAKNDDILNMIARGEEQAYLQSDDAHRTTTVIRSTLFDNPYYPAASREANIKLWKAQGEDVYRARAMGELTIDSVLMYPTFTKYVHGLDLNAENDTHLAIEQAIIDNGGQPPDSWCRYMIVDPGHQVCAVLFVAVPPPELGDFRVVYNELYIQHCDANKFAQMVPRAARDQTFQAFIIDAHGGALRDIGSGHTPREQYSAKLKEHGIRSEETGFGFLAGSDDIPGRSMKLRDWLYIREDGTTKLKVNSEVTPNLAFEFTRFKKKKIKGVVVDEPDTRTPCHLIQTLEYAAAHGLKYVKPVVRRVSNTLADRVMARRARAVQKRRGQLALTGGSSINLGPQGS